MVPFASGVQSVCPFDPWKYLFDPLVLFTHMPMFSCSSLLSPACRHRLLGLTTVWFWRWVPWGYAPACPAWLLQFMWPGCYHHTTLCPWTCSHCGDQPACPHHQSDQTTFRGVQLWFSELAVAGVRYLELSSTRRVDYRFCQTFLNLRAKELSCRMRLQVHLLQCFQRLHPVYPSHSQAGHVADSKFNRHWQICVIWYLW